MAKRRFAKAKTRTVTRFVKAKGSRRKSSGSNVKMLQFDAMIYGGIRGYISNLIAPFTSKIPLGAVADEIGMGILNYFVAKKSSGMLRDIAVKGLIIENAAIGQAITTGQLNFGSLGNAPQQQITYSY